MSEEKKDNESVNDIIAELKNDYKCPTDDGKPKKDEWCGHCREICTADGRNWCTHNDIWPVIERLEKAWARETEEFKKELVENAPLPACVIRRPPKRNCDLYDDYDSALQAFKGFWQVERDLDVEFCAECELVGSFSCFGRWLMMPVAKGKKEEKPPVE